MKFAEMICPDCSGCLPVCKRCNSTGFVSMTGAEMLAAERQRQKDKEGWTPEHDATHTNFEMTRCAILYAASAADIVITTVEWPWACCYDKREKHDQLKKLVIAGALIAAEIDRLKGA